MRSWLIAFIVGAGVLAGCSSEPQDPSVYLLPSSQLSEDGFVLEFACEVERDGADPDSNAIHGLRGIDRLDLEGFDDFPFVRTSVHVQGTPGTPLSLDAIASSSADPGSTQPITINGVEGISFTITLTTIPWPALGWIQDGIMVTMLGEGVDSSELFEIAETLEQVSKEAFLSAGFGQQRCNALTR